MKGIVKDRQVNAVNSVKASSRRKGLSFTRDELVQLHWVEGKSLTEIGKMYGVTTQAIRYWCDKLEIEHRSKVQHVLFMPSPALSYVVGVLHGDAFLYKNPANRGFEILLNVVDKPFAESFQRALACLGINAGLISVKPSQPQHQIVWKVYAKSVEFHRFWDALTSEERLDLGLQFPDQFLRGLYESEGSVKRHRGSLELTIYSTNVSMMRRVLAEIERYGLSPKWFERELESGKTFVYVSLYRALDVRKFLAWAMPVIKYEPRDANTEPSRGGDTPEGVESTKGDQDGS